MDTAYLAISKGVTIIVNGLPIHVPRQPVGRKVKREWKRLLLHAMRMAEAGMVGSMGCVVPPSPRGYSREWARWYRYAHRKSSPVRDFRRPDLEAPAPPTHEEILAAMASLADGKPPEVVKQELGLTTKQLKALLKAVRKTGREILNHKYSCIMRRVHAMRAQDMEIAAM